MSGRLRRFWQRRGAAGKAAIAAATVAVAAVLLGAGYYVWWAGAGGRWVTIREGKVYQSAALPTGELLRHVREDKLRAVVDLRDDHRDEVAAEGDALAHVGVKHFHLPTNLPPSDETVQRFLEIARDPANQPLLIHCEHGEGRSVLFAGLYRVALEGQANEAAWKETVRLPNELQFLRYLLPALGRLREDKAKYLLEFGNAEREKEHAATPGGDGGAKER